ncbi:MAG: transporter ATP-binding protein [Acidobacteria bacterium]|nr:transporter ATP-binding protein [Acidobacteriota bacterium]
MLDLSLHGLTLAPLRDVTIAFERNTHTAIVGRAGAGASTLLRAIAGEARPDSGTIHIGARDVTTLARKRRPLLYVTSAIGVPARWSVEHALIAAVRERTLDRIDRHREYELAIDKWHLSALLGRRIGALSSSERTLVHLARIELLRPGVVIADRLLEALNPSLVAEMADELHRTLRVIGATLVSAPATRLELGLMDSVAVLDEGRIVQRGTPAEVHARPLTAAAAEATGEVNRIPVTLHGTTVESPIGSWEVGDIAAPPFAGHGIALVRPGAFATVAKGEESDFVFGIEEASFRDGRWHARGFLTGGTTLHVVLPGDAKVHKGKLIALRYDAETFILIPATDTVPAPGARRGADGT